MRASGTLGRTAKRRCLLPVMCLLLGWSGVALGQEITGAWQGTLPGVENPRIIVTIAKGDGGALRGSFYWIDRFAEGIPLSSLSFVTPNLNLGSIAAGVSFRGKLSADGKEIAGNWTQDKKDYPLTLTRTAPGNVWKHEGPALLAPMAETADPAFEVATIKPSAPDAKGLSYFAHNRRFAAKNATLANLVKFAYKVQARQIEGAPAWFDEDRFDIAAEPDGQGEPSDAQYRSMLKKLLAERFQLKLHTVQKPFAVYALTVERTPAKLNPAEPGLHGNGRIVVNDLPDEQMLAQFVGASMPEFAELLMNFIGERQIVDETGLTGRFDFNITVPASVLHGADETEKATAFFRAVQSLGLKLAPKKAPLDVLVIESVEKPSAN